MKRTTLSMLITALILFCAGLLLTLFTLIYSVAAGVDLYPGQSKEKPDLGDFTKSFADLGYVSGDTVKKIEISSLVGDVEVRGTEGESKIEFYQTDLNNITVSYSEGIISVSEPTPVSYMGIGVNENGFSFNGLRQIFRSVGNASTAKKIILYLNPADFNAVLSINSEVGNVVADGFSCTELYIQGSMGKIAVTNASVTYSISVKGDFTDVFLRKNRYQQSDVNVTMGKIFALVEGQKNTLQTSLGDIIILTEKSKDDYQLRLSNTMGVITPYDLTVEENKKNEFSRYSAGTDSILAKSFFGNITLSEFDETKYPQVDFESFSDLVKVS